MTNDERSAVRNLALEEAAKIAEDYAGANGFFSELPHGSDEEWMTNPSDEALVRTGVADEIAEAIRSLKSPPPEDVTK